MLVSRITAPLPAPPAHQIPARVAPPGQAMRLAIAVIEGMTGRRPLHHLRSHLSSEAFVQLSLLRQSGKFTSSRVGGLRCQMPTEDAAEISVRISLARRWLVCVLRLDKHSTWSCSEFVVLGG